MADIKFINVSKRFGEVRAVSDFNLVVKEGEFVTLLGPSGCGKTTTLRLLAGLCAPSAGSIEIGKTKKQLASFQVPQSGQPGPAHSYERTTIRAPSEI